MSALRSFIEEKLNSFRTEEHVVGNVLHEFCLSDDKNNAENTRRKLLDIREKDDSHHFWSKILNDLCLRDEPVLPIVEIKDGKFYQVDKFSDLSKYEQLGVDDEGEWILFNDPERPEDRVRTRVLVLRDGCLRRPSRIVRVIPKGSQHVSIKSLFNRGVE